MIQKRYAEYEKFIPLGAVNFTCVSGDKAANLAKIEINMREAAAQGVNILVFTKAVERTASRHHS